MTPSKSGTARPPLAEGQPLLLAHDIGALFVTREESGIAEHMSPVFTAMLD